MEVKHFPDKKILILSDFDGTACAIDLGNSLFQRFACEGWQEIDRSYSAREVGSRDAYGRVAALIRASKEEMLAYIRANGALDPGFRDFFHLCKIKGLDIKVVSDGLDFYINAVFESHDLGDLEFYSNHAVFLPDSTLAVDFPEFNGDCRRCGTCKTAIVKGHRGQYDLIIYIGDSYSDLCAAKEADLVFAKDVLYENYRQNGNPCLPYENFGDIESQLRGMGLV